jgi:hypothetical protein
MVSGPADIHESLSILLATQPGERVLQESFGCDLDSLLFAEVDRELLNTMERLLSDAILEYEPRIQLDGLDVRPSATEPSCLLVELSYTIRGTNSRFNRVFPFYLMEAAQPGL